MSKRCRRNSKQCSPWSDCSSSFFTPLGAVWSGSTLFAQTLSVRKLRNNTVLDFFQTGCDSFDLEVFLEQMNAIFNSETQNELLMSWGMTKPTKSCCLISLCHLHLWVLGYPLSSHEDWSAFAGCMQLCRFCLASASIVFHTKKQNLHSFSHCPFLLSLQHYLGIKE